jgi:uncharacterized protein YbaA (DUF1428 family)
MYIAALVIPVPEANREAYRRWAERSADFFSEYGCLEVVEAWEDNVPDGKLTDFRKAVAARPGEKIVLQWQIWPDKAFLDAAEARMHEDPRMEAEEGIPFDPTRLILGCFTPLHVMGREAEI